MMKNSKTKRILSAVLSVVLIFTLLTSVHIYSALAETASDSSGQIAAIAADPTDPDLEGKGTADDPFQIKDKTDLEKMRDHVNAQDRYILDGGDAAYADAYYELAADIELDGSANWDPIGRGSNGISSTYTFNGSFDGKGHTISGLYFKSNSSYYTVGLFGYNAGTIKNLSVDCDITGYFWNGVIAGINYGTIENCLTSGYIDGAFNNGGIAGINRGGTIKNCLSVATADHDATDGIYGSSYDRTDTSGTTPATIENNYYIDSVAGVNVPGAVEPVSQDDLASGKVAWLLQNGVDDETVVWEQKLDDETEPKLHKADDSECYAVHQVLFHLYNTDTIVAEDYVNEGTITAPNVTVDIDGYTFGDKWFDDKAKVDGEEGAWNFASDEVKADTSLYSNKTAIEYTITYNLGDGGSWGDKEGNETGHPSKYTVEESVEISDEPVKEGYKFIGWTGTGITGSAEEVIIEKGSTGDRVYNAQYYDNENPTATITVGEDSWKYSATAIEFDTFFNTSQTVTITAEDNDDTNVDIWYYITNSPVEDVESISDWISYDSNNKPVIDPEGQYVIYAKAVDDDDNTGYTNTSGIVLEVTAPVISGVADGATYCLSVTFTAEDANLDTVTANGDALTAADDGSYTINSNGTYTITATDKAGNETTVTITVADHVEGETVTQLIREVGCETDGLELITTYCANCKAVIKSEEKVTTALGHDWGEWETIQTAACDADGVKQHTCNRCHITVSEAISQTGHAWSEEKVVLKEAFCYQEGLKAYVCSKCTATSGEEILEKLPHNYDIVSIDNEIPATCTADGSYDTVYACSMCLQEVSRVPGVYTSPGHQWGEWKTKDFPSCNDSGTLIRTCSVCSATDTKNVAPNGHTWATEPEVDQKPTCTVDGSQSIHCTVCGVSKPDSSEVIKAEGHKPADAKLIVDATPATCEANGGHYEVTVCSVCNEEISRTYVVDYSTGHDWSDWYSFTSDVCGGDTGERRDCKVCQASETRNINKLAHDWNVDEDGEYVYTEDLAPSCTQQGSESVHCRRSGCVAILDSRTIDPLGHDWGDWVVIDSPNCEDSGTEMRTCERCNTTETQGLNPNGHAWNVDESGEYVYTVDAAASCTTDGSESVHCKNCDAKINSRPIPATGHTFGEWVITDSPECEDPGTAQRECQVCGYIESENVEATGHEWADEPTIDKEPTCTEDGSQSIHCTKCDARKESTVLPMLGHDFVDGICSRCGANDGTAAAPEIVVASSDQEYVIGSNGGATIYCDGILKWFLSVSVDGEIVDEKYYTVSEGSTIITFTSEFLDTLVPGDHDVTLTFTYGEASAVLTVIEADPEQPSTDEPTTEPTTKPDDEPTTEPKDEPTTEPKDEPVTNPPAGESTTNESESNKPEGNKNPTSPSTGSARYIIGASSAVLFAAMGLALASNKKRKEDEE